MTELVRNPSTAVFVREAVQHKRKFIPHWNIVGHKLFLGKCRLTTVNLGILRKVAPK